MAIWPTSIPTDSNLYIAVNELQTNLSSGVNNSVAILPLNSTTSFPAVGLVLIDNEIIQYTGIVGSTLTGCTRGFDGMSAASHSAAAIVSFAICANHHNVVKDEIIALATYLAANLGTGAQPLSNGNRALVSNGSGKIVESSVTATQLGFLTGVTSAIQTQLDAKASLASPTFTGTITVPLTASRVVTSDASSHLSVSTCTTTEIDFVHGVTSAIQTQITGKRADFSNGQLPGTATNDNASSGNVGQYIESTSSSAVPAATSGQYDDGVSMSLTAGDWDVTAVGDYDNNGATWTAIEIGISTTTGNSGTGLSPGINNGRAQWASSSTTPLKTQLTVPVYRMSLATTTTVYLKRNFTYSAGTPRTLGMRLSARRAR